MKKFFLFGSFLLSLVPASAQGYVDVDSARKLVRLTGSPEQEFKGIRALDRFYYTTGLFDSSEQAEKKMVTIATRVKSDSLMAMVYRAIGNRYVIKTDYNFAILNYAKGLDYTDHDPQRRAGLYLNLAYVYIITGNNALALDYIRRGKALGQNGSNLYFEKLLSGFICNNLSKPDSALYYFREAENLPEKMTDPLIHSVLLLQMARAYDLGGDTELADTYFKKTMDFCNEKVLPSSIIRTGNVYCDFLIRKQKFEQAKQMALQDLQVARTAGINEGISTVAEVLRKLYAQAGIKDSIIYYAQIQIDYRDSVNNQKKQAEFQNLTFARQLREIDEQAKLDEANEQRKQNLQYAIIGLAIITFILFFLLLSRSVITSVKVIGFMSVVALLIVFEFLNLLLHPFLERATHHSPSLMLLALVCIAALLVPLHHWIEKWATHKLVEKNRQIRLAAAKKTIRLLSDEKLETDQNN